jgi:hypothetical protein
MCELSHNSVVIASWNVDMDSSNYSSSIESLK